MPPTIPRSVLPTPASPCSSRHCCRSKRAASTRSARCSPSRISTALIPSPTSSRSSPSMATIQRTATQPVGTGPASTRAISTTWNNAPRGCSASALSRISSCSIPTMAAAGASMRCHAKQANCCADMLQHASVLIATSGGASPTNTTSCASSPSATGMHGPMPSLPTIPIIISSPSTATRHATTSIGTNATPTVPSRTRLPSKHPDAQLRCSTSTRNPSSSTRYATRAI